MREFLKIITEGASRTDALAQAARAGFDTDENNLVYHGSDAEFDSFTSDPRRRRTAKHIYTSPDIRTASYYGTHVYLCAIRGKIADITQDGDYRLLAWLAEQFADRFTRDVYGDPELVEIQERVAEQLRENDPDLTQTEAEIEAEDDPEYQSVLTRVTRTHAAEYFQSGNLYSYDHRGYFQDEVLDTLFGKGYSVVRFYDYSVDGDPISVVVNSAEDIRIIERLR